MACPNTPALGLSEEMAPLFSRSEALGAFALRPLVPRLDAAIIQPWTSAPHARYWGMMQATVAEVAAWYADLIARPGHGAFLGLRDGTPCFLVERYDPACDPVACCYAVQPGDVGMHLLLAPPTTPQHGFSLAVMRTVMDFLFSDPDVGRVVVEPDWRNHRIHALNRRVGFVHQRLVHIGEKKACLAFCTREQYVAACRWRLDGYNAAGQHEATCGAAIPAAATWEAVNRALVGKALAEFAHERLIQPQRTGQHGPWEAYTLTAPGGAVTYTFCAQRLPLDHWHIDGASIARHSAGKASALDAATFIVEWADVLGILPQNLPVYVEEVAATAAARARKLDAGTLPAGALAGADFQTIETAMIEGHPTFIANSGRIGFDAQDMQRFAPESGRPLQLIWLAAHRSRTRFACSHDLDYDQLLQEELDLTTRLGFERGLMAQGLEPRDYLLLPVHPWQWANRIAHLHAGDLATRHLVVLGPGDDYYQPQQSIRTLFNVSNPARRYVKLALSVLNMGFTRGLSPYYVGTNPAINDWVAHLVAADPYLQQCGFHVLREVAGVGYCHALYGQGPLHRGSLDKTLAALWRESPVGLLRHGQRLMTMAALLHRDAGGQALVVALIQRSGLAVDDWLKRYLEAYLAPLLHCHFRHGLVFMPHGENLILVLEGDVPVRALIKDIGEEVCVLNGAVDLPAAVQRIAVTMPEDKETLSIFTDVFDCFFRYLSAMLWQGLDYPPARFWAQVAACVAAYQRAHPQLAGRFARHDLFVERFDLSCLNRLQLRNNQQMVNLADPFEALTFAGQLDNPIAPHRPGRSTTQ